VQEVATVHTGHALDCRDGSKWMCHVAAAQSLHITLTHGIYTAPLHTCMWLAHGAVANSAQGLRHRYAGF